MRSASFGLCRALRYNRKKGGNRMKKAASLFLLLALLLGLASCTVPGTNSLKNPIDFGKRYRYLGEDYVFNDDKTGYHECQNGRIDFAWREASDGAVYLFETERRYNEGCEDKELSLIKHPIYFGEEFFAYTYVSGHVYEIYLVSGDIDTYTVRYIKEGASLR